MSTDEPLEGMTVRRARAVAPSVSCVGTNFGRVRNHRALNGPERYPRFCFVRQTAHTVLTRIKLAGDLRWADKQRSRQFGRCRWPLSVGIVGRQAAAETLIEHSAESRFQLDFHLPDAALQNALPAGWEPAIATAGPAKDANLRLIFVDRVGITGADGKPVGPGTNRMAILAIPVKQTATGISGQMIIGGLTEDQADAPGPFGVYLPATVHRMERSYKTGAGSGITGKRPRDFQAAGRHLAVM
jgi:hypothetical protein